MFQLAFYKMTSSFFFYRETPHRQWDYVSSFYVIAAQLTTTGTDEFLIDDILPMTILGVTLVCGRMLAAIVVATSIQLAYATKYALTAYEKVMKELLNMLQNQGLSSKFRHCTYHNQSKRHSLCSVM